MPKFRKKYVKSNKKASGIKGSDALSYAKEKEEQGYRSSSSSYKDNIDGA
ncbi:MAG: hypothetical protein J6A47_00915 [Bacilli bacterium]|nr:hypothetical protein [Bacilli bacterium]MBO6286253.1 hypothetical protein [Bacilli bacterium]